jgi:hypothetical protein
MLYRGLPSPSYSPVTETNHLSLPLESHSSILVVAAPSPSLRLTSTPDLGAAAAEGRGANATF